MSVIENGRALVRNNTHLIVYPSASGSFTITAIISIGEYAFSNCTSLVSASFPTATEIGSGAFYGCTSLSSVNIPSVTSIGGSAFSSTSDTTLTITMRNTAPTVGTSVFASVNTTKSVTVRVPAGVSGYGTSPTDTTTNNWGNAFRGRGWNGTSYQTGTVNANVQLTIVYE